MKKAFLFTASIFWVVLPSGWVLASDQAINISDDFEQTETYEYTGESSCPLGDAKNKDCLGGVDLATEDGYGENATAQDLPYAGKVTSTRGVLVVAKSIASRKLAQAELRCKSDGGNLIVYERQVSRVHVVGCSRCTYWRVVIHYTCTAD